MSGCEKIKDKSLNLDIYKRPFNFLMPDHRETYNTWLGLVLSLFSIICVFSYAIYQMISLIQLDQYRLQTIAQENFYAEDQELK